MTVLFVFWYTLDNDVRMSAKSNACLPLASTMRGTTQPQYRMVGAINRVTMLLKARKLGGLGDSTPLIKQNVRVS